MLSKAYVPNCRPNEAKTKELEIQHDIVVRWSLAVCEQRGSGLKLTLLPEDQQVSFLVGTYVMLSKTYVPNFRLSELKSAKLAVPGVEPGSSGSQPLMLTTTPYDHFVCLPR